jgi:hypothetical protein
MIKVNILHYNIKRQLNRFNSSYNKHISTIDIDAYINQAKEILLENLSAVITKNRTVSNNFKSLVIADYKLLPLNSNDQFTSFKLPEDHYYTLSANALASKSTCKENIFLHPIKYHKVEESLRDPKWTPSFNWRESFYTEHLKNINCYHNKDFNYDSMNITYIKYIPDVANVSHVTNGVYIKADGSTISVDKHLEIDSESVRRKLEDLAIMLIRRDMDENYKVNLETILFSDKAFI